MSDFSSLTPRPPQKLPVLKNHGTIGHLGKAAEWSGVTGATVTGLPDGVWTGPGCCAQDRSSDGSAGSPNFVAWGRGKQRFNEAGKLSQKPTA